MRTLLLLLFLGSVWLLLSGHTNPLLLTLGAVSCLIVWYFSHQMDLVDHEDHPLHLKLVRLMKYSTWLSAQVVKSNFDVALRIVSPSLPIRPQLLKVRTSQRTELGQVIYANSITLTPGTVSIDLTGHQIEVHALTEESAAELLSGGMDRRVTAVERPHPQDPQAGQR